MRRFVPYVVTALAAATPLHASTALTGTEPRGDAAAAEIAEPAEPQPAIADAAPGAPELQLESVRVQERAAADDAEAAQLPRRGSFWWLVGVIVVAGVILAVLL